MHCSRRRVLSVDRGAVECVPSKFEPLKDSLPIISWDGVFFSDQVGSCGVMLFTAESCGSNE